MKNNFFLTLILIPFMVCCTNSAFNNALNKKNIFYHEGLPSNDDTFNDNDIWFDLSSSDVYQFFDNEWCYTRGIKDLDFKDEKFLPVWRDTSGEETVIGNALLRTLFYSNYTKRIRMYFSDTLYEDWREYASGHELYRFFDFFIDGSRWCNTFIYYKEYKDTTFYIYTFPQIVDLEQDKKEILLAPFSKYKGSYSYSYHVHAFVKSLKNRHLDGLNLSMYSIPIWKSENVVSSAEYEISFSSDWLFMERIKVTHRSFNVTSEDLKTKIMSLDSFNPNLYEELDERIENKSIIDAEFSSFGTTVVNSYNLEGETLVVENKKE